MPYTLKSWSNLTKNVLFKVTMGITNTCIFKLMVSKIKEYK